MGINKDGSRTTSTSRIDFGVYNVLPVIWDSSYISEIDLREYGGEYKSVLGKGPEHGRCGDTEWSSCQSCTSGHVEDDIQNDHIVRV